MEEQPQDLVDEKIGDDAESQEELIITPEQKKIILDFMKASSQYAIPDDVDVPTHSEVVMADRLLNLDLPSSDWGPVAYHKYSEYPYKPELESREETMSDAGLPGRKDISILRQNVSMRTDGLDVKIISLVQDALDEERNIVHKKIPGGILFIGKVIFNNNREEYIPLTDDDVSRIERFIDERTNKD